MSTTHRHPPGAEREINLNIDLFPAEACDRNEEAYTGNDTDSYQMIEYGLKYVSSLSSPSQLLSLSICYQKYFLQNKIFFSSWIELIFMKFPWEMKWENILLPQSGRWQ